MSFYSYKNANTCTCPGTATGNDILNGLNKRVCIQVKNVYDACLQQEQLSDKKVVVSNIVPVLPAGCGLIDVKVENGVAKLNFTKEFAEIALNNDGGRLALKALVLTCTQFDGVDSVEIYVEGEKYDPGKDTLSVPTFANVADSIVYDYIQTQSAMLVDE